VTKSHQVMEKHWELW